MSEEFPRIWERRFSFHKRSGCGSKLGSTVEQRQVALLIRQRGFGCHGQFHLAGSAVPAQNLRWRRYLPTAVSEILIQLLPWRIRQTHTTLALQTLRSCACDDCQVAGDDDSGTW